MPDRPRRKAPPFLDPIGERLLAHTDAERDLAIAELRIAHAEFKRAEAEWLAATTRRENAALRAREVGVDVRPIAEVYETHHGNISRMTARAHRKRLNGKG